MNLSILFRPVTALFWSSVKSATKILLKEIWSGNKSVIESSEKMSDSAISDFMNITGCADHARAKFYIDSANGDIDAAVISFFESAGDEQVHYRLSLNGT